MVRDLLALGSVLAFAAVLITAAQLRAEPRQDPTAPRYDLERILP